MNIFAKKGRGKGKGAAFGKSSRGKSLVPEKVAEDTRAVTSLGKCTGSSEVKLKEALWEINCCEALRGFVLYYIGNR